MEILLYNLPHVIASSTFRHSFGSGRDDVVFSNFFLSKFLYPPTKEVGYLGTYIYSPASVCPDLNFCELLPQFSC